MTTTDNLSLIEIQSKGLEMLSRELGPVGLIRFLQQFDSGAGDYTAECSQWLGAPTVAELARHIRAKRPKPDSDAENLAEANWPE
jgi:hypothetical protein